MGTWGTSLYDNDSTSDIRGNYLDKLKRGKTNEEATKELVDAHMNIDDAEEEPLFWLALADTQWNYGRLLPKVKEKAMFYLSQDKEWERWKESGEKSYLLGKEPLRHSIKNWSLRSHQSKRCQNIVYTSVNGIWVMFLHIVFLVIIVKRTALRESM